MNIEDWDFNIEKKNISSIELKSIKLTEKDHKFSISINVGNTSDNLNCKILFDNVYEEKKRCFIVNEINVSQGENLVAQNDNVLRRKTNYIDDSELVLSAKSHIVSEFSLSSSIDSANIHKNAG